MKSIRSFFVAALASCTLWGMQSCVNTNDTSMPVNFVDLSSADIAFDEGGYWAGCYTPGNFVADGITFTHNAWADVWDGVSYPAWNGFCPSKVNDNAEYKDDWTNHQWACMPYNSMNVVYLVGNSEAVVSENAIDNNKCVIRRGYNSYFTPQYISVTNSSYTYYCAKNGSAFNEPFTAEDELVLHIVGTRGGAVTGHLRLYLIKELQFLTQWYPVDLSGFGEIEELLFYIDSTQKNSYGLTIPAYFCIGGFAYSLPVDYSYN